MGIRQELEATIASHEASDAALQATLNSALADNLRTQTELTEVKDTLNKERLAINAERAEWVSKSKNYETIIEELKLTIEKLENPEPPVDETIYAGTRPIGTANYEVPVNAMFVSPTGSDSNAGTKDAPKKTIKAASIAVPAGGTVVVREGVYHENFTTVRDKKVTFQNYPNEKVWMDGSFVISNWTKVGAVWTANYALKQNRNVTVSTTSWAGPDPARFLPDQLWINGVAQKQILDGVIPAAGQFSVDQTAGKISVGSDPTGKEVRGSDLYVGLTIIGPGALKGIGIRKFSPQVVEGMNSAVYLAAPDFTFENVSIEDSSFGGLTIIKPNATLKDVSIKDSGHAGIQATVADNLNIDGLHVIRANKFGGWNGAPACGGIKVTRTHNYIIKNSIFEETPNVMAAWTDVSCTAVKYVNLAAKGNFSTAFEIEETDGGVVDGKQYKCFIIGCRADGAKRSFGVYNAGTSEHWNNSSKNTTSVHFYIQQTGPFNSGTQAANFSKERSPWETKRIKLVNNYADGTNHQILAYDEFYKNTAQVTLGADMFISEAHAKGIDGNHFEAGAHCVAELGKSTAYRVSYADFAALAKAGPEVGNITAVLGKNYQGSDVNEAKKVLVPLSAEVAALVGKKAGDLVYGPPLPAPVVRT